MLIMPSFRFYLIKICKRNLVKAILKTFEISNFLVKFLCLNKKYLTKNGIIIYENNNDLCVLIAY